MSIRTVSFSSEISSEEQAEEAETFEFEGADLAQDQEDEGQADREVEEGQAVAVPEFEPENDGDQPPEQVCKGFHFPSACLHREAQRVMES